MVARRTSASVRLDVFELLLAQLLIDQLGQLCANLRVDVTFSDHLEARLGRTAELRLELLVFLTWRAQWRAGRRVWV